MDASPTRREELANSLSHGLGFVSFLVGAPFLVRGAVRHGDAGNVVGALVFAVTLVFLYLASTLYHAAPGGPIKERLRKLDHAAIYLLIAGTYTPFTLGALEGAWGWSLLALVWTAAAVGATVKLIVGVRHPRWSTGLYLAMGWLMLVAARPLAQNVPVEGLLLIGAGGVAYTVGVIFYASSRLPYAHAIWHLFVLTGSTCHFFAVLRYAG